MATVWLGVIESVFVSFSVIESVRQAARVIMDNANPDNPTQRVISLDFARTDYCDFSVPMGRGSHTLHPAQLRKTKSQCSLFQQGSEVKAPNKVPAKWLRACEYLLRRLRMASAESG